MSENVKGYIICEGATEGEVPKIVSNNDMSVKIKTTLQTADIQNRNKRIYGKNIISEGLQADFIQERLRTKSWYGECGHPVTADIQRLMGIEHTRISHIIESVYWDASQPNYLKGIVETANTAIGRDMKGLIEQKSQVAFSLRALGGVEDTGSGILRVKSPLRINTFDWVVHPSHKEAYMDNVLTESMMNVFNIEDSILTEGVMIPVSLTEAEILDVVRDSSKNFVNLVNQLEINPLSENSSIILNENKRTLYIQDGEKKAIVKLEDYSRKSFEDFLISKL